VGTSDAYGGSAGRGWQQARDSVADLVGNPNSPEQQVDVMSCLADALDWDDGNAAPNPGTSDQLQLVEDQPDPMPVPQQPFGRLVRPRGSTTDGPGSGGGGATGSPGGGRTAANGAARRSRHRAASVGGAVLAAGLAVRRNDAVTLDALGLSLTDLRGLSPVAQCSRILKALVGSGADIDESEMLAASSNALVAVLTESLTPAAAVRVFIVEYVMEISVTELGATMRERGSGEVSVQVEDGLRSLVTAQVDQIQLNDDRLDPQHLQDALFGALGSAQAVLRAMS
jgi:hypothetical protein